MTLRFEQGSTGVNVRWHRSLILALNKIAIVKIQEISFIVYSNYFKTSREDLHRKKINIPNARQKLRIFRYFTQAENNQKLRSATP